MEINENLDHYSNELASEVSRIFSYQNDDTIHFETVASLRNALLHTCSTDVSMIPSIIFDPYFQYFITTCIMDQTKNIVAVNEKEIKWKYYFFEDSIDLQCMLLSHITTICSTVPPPPPPNDSTMLILISELLKQNYFPFMNYLKRCLSSDKDGAGSNNSSREQIKLKLSVLSHLGSRAFRELVSLMAKEQGADYIFDHFFNQFLPCVTDLLLNCQRNETWYFNDGSEVRFDEVCDADSGTSLREQAQTIIHKMIYNEDLSEKSHVLRGRIMRMLQSYMDQLLSDEHFFKLTKREVEIMVEFVCNLAVINDQFQFIYQLLDSRSDSLTGMAKNACCYTIASNEYFENQISASQVDPQCIQLLNMLCSLTIDEDVEVRYNALDTLIEVISTNWQASHTNPLLRQLLDDLIDFAIPSAIDVALDQPIAPFDYRESPIIYNLDSILSIVMSIAKIKFKHNPTVREQEWNMRQNVPWN